MVKRGAGSKSAWAIQSTSKVIGEDSKTRSAARAPVDWQTRPDVGWGKDRRAGAGDATGFGTDAHDERASGRGRRAAGIPRRISGENQDVPARPRGLFSDHAPAQGEPRSLPHSN